VRLILLHNPSAGDEDHSRGRIEGLLEKAGHEVRYRSLKEEGWDEVLSESADLVVVAGGDGSVRKLFTAIGSPRTTATLLPMGSANNIARTLGFDTEDAATLLTGWEPAHVRPFDLWNVESAWGESRCVESVGGGLFARVLERAESEDDEPGGDDKVERGLHLLAKTLREARAAEWTIDLDGVHTREELLGLEAMNVRELGPNLPLAPEADPGDGELDVVLIRPRDAEPLAAYVEARLRGEQPSLPPLETRRASHLVLEPPREASLHVDDLLPAWDEGSAPWVEIRRADVALDVLVPR
jgi:diacylglycerol kinase (ATP)